MIVSLKAFITQYIVSDVVEDSDAALKMAAAALLIEMVRADADAFEQEYEAVRVALSEVFNFSEEESRDLSELAKTAVDESSSLHQFTRLINQHFDQGRKIQLIEMLWRVAYADGRLDRYEEYLMRKLADLLYVSHRDYLQAKHRISRGQSS
ncbi:MAG: TerB family tellurite resistance protein [Gammaproteobacteria bacterium]|nr:TerB family tellurite resistance protein [Gammaproteobacteria bacterium]